MGLFEPIHLVVILAIALVIFGPGKIGDLGATLGRSIRDFKRAMNEETPAPSPAIQTATLQAAPAAQEVATAVPPESQASVQPHAAPTGAAAKSPDAPASA